MGAFVEVPIFLILPAVLLSHHTRLYYLTDNNTFKAKKCATHPSASGALLTYSQILYLGYGSKPDISLVSLYRTSQSVPNLLQCYINSLTFRRQRASEVTLRDTTPTL